MTYKEALRIEHPEKVDDIYTGGCAGCPHDYFGNGDNPIICFGTSRDGGCCEENCRSCWDREMPGKEPETFRELLQKEHPDRVSPKFDGGCFACPTTYDYESDEDNKKACACMNCTECWDRKLPKKAEEPVEIKIEEEKKMRNLRALIESKVEDAIASGKIDEYIENIVEDMDLDGDIDDLIETEIRENIDDYVDPILSETVRDAVREALDNLFN